MKRHPFPTKAIKLYSWRADKMMVFRALRPFPGPAPFSVPVNVPVNVPVRVPGPFERGIRIAERGI